jgi:hypothetical protein
LHNDEYQRYNNKRQVIDYLLECEKTGDQYIKIEIKQSYKEEVVYYFPGEEPGMLDLDPVDKEREKQETGPNYNMQSYAE